MFEATLFFFYNISVLLCVLIGSAAIVTIFAILIDPVCAKTYRHWTQRQTLARLKGRLRKHIAKKKSDLRSVWNHNPAAQCATLFKVFNQPNKDRKVTMEVLANDVDYAITETSKRFESNFLLLYIEKYNQSIQCETSEIVISLANELPENAEYIMTALTKDDQAKRDEFEILVSQALGKGNEPFVLVRTQLVSLRHLLPRFRELLHSGAGSKIGSIVVGALTGGVLAWLGISNSFLIFKASRFTASNWSNWRGKANEEFGDQFVQALQDIQNACETLDLSVGRSLDRALEEYCRYWHDYCLSLIEVLANISRAGWDIRPSIASLRAKWK